MAYLQAGQDNEDIARSTAAAKIPKAMGQAGAAYSNKRQFDRDFYANSLAQRAASYQGAMNMLGASGGATPNIAGLDPQNNPLTMRMTGVGSTQGSNYNGWRDQRDKEGGPRYGGTNGIGAYLDGTNFGEGTFDVPRGAGQGAVNSAVSGGIPGVNTPGGNINNINTANGGQPGWSGAMQQAAPAPQQGISFQRRRP